MNNHINHSVLQQYVNIHVHFGNAEREGQESTLGFTGTVEAHTWTWLLMMSKKLSLLCVRSSVHKKGLFLKPETVSSNHRVEGNTALCVVTGFWMALHAFLFSCGS